MRIVLVHGFNVRDPAKTIGKLAALYVAEGVPADHVKLFRYGWLGLLGVKFGNDNLAEALRCLLLEVADRGEPVIVVAHSNGAALVHRAAWLMDEWGDPHGVIERAVYLSPALDRDAQPSPAVKAYDVFYTANDWAVRFSRLWPSEWGDMGARGPSDDYGGKYRKVNGSCVIQSHSGYFAETSQNFMLERHVRPLVAQYGRG